MGGVQDDGVTKMAIFMYGNWTENGKYEIKLTKIGEKLILNQNLFDGERILPYFGDGNPEMEGRVRPPLYTKRNTDSLIEW